MDWQVLALMAAFASVMVAALLIMFSRFFDFKMLEQAGKAELVFAASAVLVTLFLIAAVQYGTDAGKSIAAQMYEYTYKHAGYLHYRDSGGVEQELTSAMFTSNQYSLIDIMILYMDSVMYCAEDIGAWTFRISLFAHQISSISQDVFMAFPMSGWAWGGLAQVCDNLLNTVYFMELIFYIQKYVLRFMDAYALSIFLPLGIVMRAFPPTRGAGAYVISFSLAIYIVYPLAYLAVIFSSPYPNLCATPQIPEPSLGENAKAGIFSELRMWYRAFEGGILDLIGKFSDLTNALLVNLCFFPVVALAIAMTFTQGASGIFGANIPEVGRGLIKLI